MRSSAIQPPGSNPGWRKHRGHFTYSKRGHSLTYRTHHRGPELQAPFSVRWLGSPLFMLLSEAQMSDYKGPAFMIDAFPSAKAMLGDQC